AREGLAARHRVAGSAIGGGGEILAARDQSRAGRLACARLHGVEPRRQEKEQQRRDEQHGQHAEYDATLHASSPAALPSQASVSEPAAAVSAITLSRAVSSISAARSNGSLRSRTPVAAKIALPSAGAAETVPDSPTPPGSSALSTTLTVKG